ncbi:hypothetical protein [Corallococcus sicarius]|uniref:hypothetical protein n=1 Tax=Corallococcus sicarius TaxID=2316726 RepID=UPI001ABFEACF|nr:hypothetical protein [Corallococcus sicarius]
MSALEAKLKAEGEYDVYRKRQDAEFVSDFDRVVEETKRLDSGAMTRGTAKPGEVFSKSRKKP